MYNDEFARTENKLKIDDTTDKNIRYESTNPNNYVKFNDELWRIIGVFGDNVKIMRNEKLGNLSWDTSESNINEGEGVNEWSQADLKEYLNTMYYGGSAVTCYNGENNATTTCPIASLNNVAKEMIDNHIWYTGASHFNFVYDFYKEERSDVNGKFCSSSNDKYCNDTVERTTSWTGYVGLPSMSDFVFASGDEYDFSDDNWMRSGESMWSIVPGFYERNPGASYVWMMSESTAINYAYNARSVFPTIYLKSDVKTTGGTGTNTDPYILSLN